MDTNEYLRTRFAVSEWQADVVLQATKLIIESGCWSSDTQLEDMIDALAWNLRDYSEAQFYARCAAEREAA